MAKKHGNEETSGGVVFDQRTRTVMATNHISGDNVKAKIAKVRECVPNNIRKDDIAIILEHFDNDTSQAIDAFTHGNADSILQTWTISGKKGGKGTQSSKRKRRNRHGNQNNAENEESIQNPSRSHPTGNSGSLDITKESTTSSAKLLPNTSSSSVRIPQPGNNNKATQPNLNHPDGVRGDQPPTRRDQPPNRQGAPQSSRQGDRRPGGRGQQRSQEIRNRPDRGSGDRGNQRRRDGGGDHGRPNRIGIERNDRTTAQHEEDKEASGEPSKKRGANLERLEKDLNRTIVSLTRCRSVLTTQLEDSEKRLKKSMQEAQRQLQEREIVLKDEFNDVKRQTETLIDNRQKLAAELKVKIANSQSLEETELLELRASVKHFVSDRKTDEEIAQTMRYTYNPDQLVAEIKKYGDVNKDVVGYSSRRPSISSLSTISRTTSVCEDIPLSRGVSLTESIKSPDSTGPKSPEMDLSAEADNFAAKLQQKFQSRGRGGPPRNRGPRNQSGSRGRQVGGGRQRQNSGGQDQGRQRQDSGNQDNRRQRQNSGRQDPDRRQQYRGGSRDGGRRRQDSDSQDGSGKAAQKQHVEGDKDGQGQRSPRRGRQPRGQQQSQSGKPVSPKQETSSEEKVVPAEKEPVQKEEGSSPGDSPKKQRNFARRSQHRRRQGARRDDSEQEKGESTAETSGDSPKATAGQPKAAGDAPKMTESDSKVTENESKPKSEEGKSETKPTKNGPKVTQNGPKVTPNGPKESEKVTNGTSGGEILQNGGPLENGGDFSTSADTGNGSHDHHSEMKTAKKIEKIERQRDQKETAVMVNGDGIHTEKNGDGEEK